MDWGGEGWRGVLGMVEEAGGVGGGFGRVGMLHLVSLSYTKYTIWIREEKSGSDDFFFGGRRRAVLCMVVANGVMVGFLFCL